jgi:hypothetical protein
MKMDLFLRMNGKREPYVRRKQSLRAVRTDCVVELRESRVLVVELDLLSATFWLCVYLLTIVVT